jgi:tRNA(fMet)-specific endonuclease VapC
VSLRFLLDADVVSEPIGPEPNERLLERMAEHSGTLAIAAPTWHELRFGCDRLPKSRRKNLIESYLDTFVRVDFPVLPYDEAAAAWHARERARLLAQGREPSFVAGQIAAIAGVHGLILVTANRADFADFEDLQLDDWLS